MRQPMVPQGAFPYPLIPLYLARFLQSVSSCVVSVAITYVFTNLNHDQRSTPWMILFLQGAAVLTLVANLIMGLVMRSRPVMPLTSSIVNSVLAALWIAGYGLFLYAIEPLIMMPCTMDRLGTRQRVQACGIYKALIAFGAVGIASTVSMVIMDIRAARMIKKRKAGMEEDETPLATMSGNTAYTPVWNGQRATPTPQGMEPTRDETARS
ncbi:hypothetical protein ACJZ2D_003792 [Fusarium nematophilum]